jgi:nicotinic acid mononucleotide adenylyltransferase
MDGGVIFLIGIVVWIIYGFIKHMNKWEKERTIKRETQFGYAEREDNKAKYNKLAESRWLCSDYYSTGQARFENYYKDNEKCGVWIDYTIDGTIKKKRVYS